MNHTMGLFKNEVCNHRVGMDEAALREKDSKNKKGCLRFIPGGVAIAKLLEKGISGGDLYSSVADLKTDDTNSGQPKPEKNELKG